MEGLDWGPSSGFSCQSAVTVTRHPHPSIVMYTGTPHAMIDPTPGLDLSFFFLARVVQQLPVSHSA